MKGNSVNNLLVVQSLGFHTLFVSLPFLYPFPFSVPRPIFIDKPFCIDIVF